MEQLKYHFHFNKVFINKYCDIVRLADWSPRKCFRTKSSIIIFDWLRKLKQLNNLDRNCFFNLFENNTGWAVNNAPKHIKQF